MSNIRNSRIIPIALVVILSIVAIAALASLARVVFFSGTSPVATSSDAGQQSLISTTADRSVTMTVRGPIVADENFRSYQIVVTPSKRTLTTYSGYLDKKLDQISLANNIPAYEEFVHALDRADLMQGTELKGDNNDVRGLCAIGSLYEFTTLQSEKPVKSLWTTTCKSIKGSLSARMVTVKSLFIAQIPNARTQISEIRL